MKKHISIAAVLLFGIILLYSADKNTEEVSLKITENLPKQYDTIEEYRAGPGQWLEQTLSKEDRKRLIQAFSVEEQEVYTFLQGPKSWSEGEKWSGEWCFFNVKGNSFGNFGCGLCCMANIYDTLSPYEVSPWDMCEYAMSVSGYAPRKKSGAIDWGNMKVVLKKCGIVCDVYYKPDTYETFQQQIARSKSAVVLVCSADDNTYWKDTPGHYVNIWLYQEEDDSVFLAEPGSPAHNRTRIPLRYVYDALKTTSKFQYLLAEEYQEENNQWKATGIKESWNRP